MPVGVDEPPPAVLLLDAEEARGLRLRIGEPPVAAEAGVERSEGALLVPPRASQVLHGAGLPGPRVEHGLPELVHEGQAVEHGVAGGLSLEADGAHLQRRGADRLLHLEPDRLDVGQRHERAPQPQEVPESRAVPHRGHVVPGGGSLRQQRHGDRGAEPGTGVRVEQHTAESLLPGAAIPGMDTDVDPLRRRRPHLQNERLVAREVAREVGRDVGKGDSRPARRLGRVERDRGGQDLFPTIGPSGVGPDGQRGQENGRQAPTRHAAPPARRHATPARASRSTVLVHQSVWPVEPGRRSRHRIR